MNNLLIQPAQLAVKTVVPGSSDGHSANGDPPSSVKNDRSFEKTLQKARRRQVPDEQEQTLVSETLPGQTALSQTQASAQQNQGQKDTAQANSASANNTQAVSTLSEPQRVTDATASAASVQGTTLGAKTLVDSSILVPVVATIEAGEQQAVEMTTPQSAVLSSLASAEMPQPAAQVNNLSEQTVEENAADANAIDFAALLKNARNTAATAETKADSLQDEKPVEFNQPITVESGKSETAARTELQQQSAAESVPAAKTKIAAVKEGDAPVTVLNHTSAVNSSDGAAPVIEPARMAEARQAQILRQVSAGVETMTRTGQNTLRLQLFPENMGKIDLRMTMSKDGMLVTLLADTPSTSTVLNQHLPELRVTLAEAGVNIAGLSVNSGNVGGQYSAQDQRQAMYSQSQLGQPSMAAADKTSDERQAMRLRDPETNVDYLV